MNSLFYFPYHAEKEFRIIDVLLCAQIKYTNNSFSENIVQSSWTKEIEF